MQKERKKPKARRTDFVANIDIAVVDDDQWNHVDENCKVCGIGFQEQVVYTVPCTVYIVQCTVYSEQCTVYCVQGTENTFLYFFSLFLWVDRQ